MSLFAFLSDRIIISVFSAIGGITLTLITKFGNGWINEFFENRKQKKAIKSKAAEDICAFCVEGMHKGFKIRAGSEQHIKLRATQIEAIDVMVGRKLREFLDSWSQYRNYMKTGSFSITDAEMVEGYKDKAQKLGEELLEVAKKWSK